MSMNNSRYEKLFKEQSVWRSIAAAADQCDLIMPGSIFRNKRVIRKRYAN